MQERVSNNSQFRTLRAAALQCGMEESEADEKLEAIRQLLIGMRELHRMSRQRLAKRAKVPLYAIEGYEKGNDEIDERAFSRMCSTLGIGIQFGGDTCLPAMGAKEVQFGIVPEEECMQCKMERALWN